MKIHLQIQFLHIIIEFRFMCREAGNHAKPREKVFKYFAQDFR